MSFSAISSALSGMRAAAAQAQASASNIANALTTGAVPGSATAKGNVVYQPESVVQYDIGNGNQAGEVGYRVTPDPSAYAQSYEPNSASANAEGMVATPKVDLGAEMVKITEARLQYAMATRVVRAEANMQRAAIDMVA